MLADQSDAPINTDETDWIAKRSFSSLDIFLTIKKIVTEGKYRAIRRLFICIPAKDGASLLASFIGWKELYSKGRSRSNSSIELSIVRLTVQLVEDRLPLNPNPKTYPMR